MRQPVKGKPHIVPCLLHTVAGAPKEAEFCMLGDNWAHQLDAWSWATMVEPAWTRWWRQHQEAV